MLYSDLITPYEIMSCQIRSRRVQDRLL